MFRGYDPANPTREQVEIAWAAHGLSVVVVEGDRRTGKLTPVTAPPAQPPGHRHHRVPGHRAGRRVSPSQDLRRPDRPQGPRHAQQLRRRHHPVGHDAARRGELQPVLRQRLPGHRQAVRHRHRRHRAQVGAVRQAVRRRAGAQRGRTGSAMSSSSTRTTPPPRPASAPRSDGSSTRPRSHPADLRRASRRLHRRRRALRLLLQVRRQQADAARGLARPSVSTTSPCSTRARCTSPSSPVTPRPSRSTAREAARRRRVRRQRYVDPAGDRHRQGRRLARRRA